MGLVAVSNSIGFAQFPRRLGRAQVEVDRFFPQAAAGEDVRGHVERVGHGGGDAGVAVADLERAIRQQREIVGVDLVVLRAGMVRDFRLHFLQRGDRFELEAVRLVLRDEARGREVIKRAEREGVGIIRIALGQRGPRAVEGLESRDIIARRRRAEIPVERFEIGPLPWRRGRTGEPAANIFRALLPLGGGRRIGPERMNDRHRPAPVGEGAGGVDGRGLGELAVGLGIHHVVHKLHPADDVLLRFGPAADREVDGA